MSIVRDCPVCGRRSTAVLYHPRGSPGPISRCNQCQMVFVASIDDADALIFDGPVIYAECDDTILTSSDLEEVKDFWELRGIKEKEAEAACLRQNSLCALEKIDQYLGKRHENHRILDFGSGFGFFLAFAKERGWQTYGVEPLPGAAVYARAKFDLEILTDTLHENIFQDDFFDAVTAFQVFEHIPDPPRNLKYIAKSMKKGGVIVIEVPCFDTWSMRLLGSRHRHFVQDHLNFFTCKTLSILLEENGFEIMESFHPKRMMSLQHLYTCWIKPKLPHSISERVQTLLQIGRLWERVFGINIGDILTVVGCKI